MSSQDNTRVAVTLALAVTDDVPDLLKIHAAAYRSDMFSQLMLLNRPEDAHQIRVKNIIDYWLTDPHAQIVKALDEDGHVVGWACWVLKGAELDQASKDTAAAAAAARAQGASTVETKIAEERHPGPVDTSDQPVATHGQEQHREHQSTTQDPARALGGVMRKEAIKWEDEHVKGKRHMVLQGLATSPSLQGRGIGTRLVQWGADKADTEDIPCWVHASPAGYALYARAGFEELGRSDFDLAEWAPGGKGGGRGWGLYTFRYMFRPAKTSRSASCDQTHLMH